jgi:hypothetical protein
MTLEEAKKILEKEGFHLVLAKKVIYQNGAIREFEKPEVCEAIKVANANRWTVGLSPTEWDEREARLKDEYGKNHIKCGEPIPGSPALKEAASQFNDALLDEQAKKIDEQNHEITRLLSLVEKKENSISRLYYEKSVLEKENEDLKKGEIPARYFDKALVDEQAEKIKKLEHEKLDILEIASSSKQTITEQADKIKRLGKEISKLNSIIHDKNAVLSDVAEELRLTKIREKNLAELGLKYVGENEKLKKELADKVVGKINAQALKSAESALAYKEEVIAEKDEVISDLCKELAEAKKLNTAKILDFNAKCMRDARESINDVFESYAAKYAKSTLDELKDKAYESFNAKAHKLGLVGSKDGNGIFDQMVGTDFAEEGADLSGIFVLCGKDFIDALKNVKDVWQE